MSTQLLISSPVIFFTARVPLRRAIDCLYVEFQKVVFMETEQNGGCQGLNHFSEPLNPELQRVEVESWGSPPSQPACNSGSPFYVSVQFSSVAQSCPTLCNPMNRSTPGLPVHHQLLEFTQTHVHQVGDAIQPSHPLSSPSRPAPNPSQNQGLSNFMDS